MHFSFLSLYVYRKIRGKDATKFHLQLCVAILCMLLSFLIGVNRTEVPELCTFFSVLILYFTHASVFWMGAEALLMGKKLIFDIFGRVSMTKFTILVSFIAWGEYIYVYSKHTSCINVCYQFCCPFIIHLNSVMESI